MTIQIKGTQKISIILEHETFHSKTLTVGRTYSYIRAKLTVNFIEKKEEQKTTDNKFNFKRLGKSKTES